MKPEFGKALRARFKELGMQLKSVENKLCVKKSTLQSWCGKTGFPKRRMEEILELAQWPMTLDEVKARFQIKIRENEDRSEARREKAATGLMSELRLLDRRRQPIEKRFEELGRQTKRLPEFMGAHDFAASLSSTVMPFAFRHRHEGCREFVESIAGAIARQAIFVFFTPTEKVVTDYYIKTWGMTGTESPRAFADGFQMLREACIKHLSQESVRQCLPHDCHPERWVDSRLAHFPVDDCPMWVPGFVFTLLGRTDHCTEWRAVVRVPDGKFGGMFPFPEEEHFRNRLLDFCRRESKRLYEYAEEELRRFNRHAPGTGGQRRISAAKLRAKEDQVMLLKRFKALVNREEGYLHLIREETSPGPGQEV
jgi:hypothetical protein